METQATDIVIAAGAELIAAYSDSKKIERLICRIEEEARRHALDTSTAKGRKAIASLAHKIARSKTAIDGAGKTLNADMRKKIEIVDIERRRVRDRLDALKSEVRRPLDEWEEAEEARKAGHRARIEQLRFLEIDSTSTSDEINNALNEIRSVEVTGATFEEFDGMAKEVKDATICRLGELLVVAIEREEQAEELERLRKEKAEREEEERRRAAAQAEKERKDREEQAKREAAERAEREKRAAALAAAAEAEKRAREEAAEREAKLQRELAEERERAKRAAELERKKIEEEREKREREAAVRKENADYRNKIRAEIISSIMAVTGASMPSLADAIIDGKIRHVRVEM